MNEALDNLKSQIENMTTTISDMQKTSAMRECKIIDLTAENEELKETISKMYGNRFEPDKIDILWHKSLKIGR
jgi:regulator of replication initiation timing